MIKLELEVDAKCPKCGEMSCLIFNDDDLMAILNHWYGELVNNNKIQIKSQEV